MPIHPLNSVTQKTVYTRTPVTFKGNKENIPPTPSSETTLNLGNIDTSASDPLRATVIKNYAWQRQLPAIMKAQLSDYLPKGVELYGIYNDAELQEMSADFKDYSNKSTSIASPVAFHEDALMSMSRTSIRLFMDFQRKAEKCNSARIEKREEDSSPIEGKIRYEHQNGKTIMYHMIDIETAKKLLSKDIPVTEVPEYGYVLALDEDGTITYRGEGLKATGALGSHKLDFEYIGNDPHLLKYVKGGKNGTTTMITRYPQEPVERVVHATGKDHTVIFANITKRSGKIHAFAEAYNAATGEIVEVKEVKMSLPKGIAEISTIKPEPHQNYGRVFEKATINSDNELISYGKFICEDGICTSAKTFDA